MAKKILLVVRWPVGGIRTFIRYVYPDLEPGKWQLTVLAPDMPEMRLLLEEIAGLSVRYLPTEPQPTALRFFARIASELWRQEYDLVHSHGFTSGMGTALPAFVRGVPHLMTAHETLNSNQFRGVKGAATRFVMSRLLRLIDVLHSVSHDAQDNLQEFFPVVARENGRCVVIPNGIDVERFASAAPRDLRRELGIPDHAFLIGFFGRFMSPKGFCYLVDAVEILRADYRLPRRPVVLAFGAGGFILEEQSSIEKRGLQDNFMFLPFTPDIAGTIKGVDVVAMPSLREAGPLLPMEVLVCGTPFIGSDCVGLREVLRGTPCRVVARANAAELARELAREMMDNSKASFASFRSTASALFDVRKTSHSLQDLYHRILKK